MFTFFIPHTFYSQTHPALTCSVLYTFIHLMLHIRNIMISPEKCKALAFQFLFFFKKICRNYCLQSILHHKISIYDTMKLTSFFQYKVPIGLSQNQCCPEFFHTQVKVNLRSKAGVCMSAVKSNKIGEIVDCWHKPLPLPCLRVGCWSALREGLLLRVPLGERDARSGARLNVFLGLSQSREREMGRWMTFQIPLS